MCVCFECVGNSLDAQLTEARQSETSLLAAYVEKLVANVTGANVPRLRVGVVLRRRGSVGRRARRRGADLCRTCRQAGALSTCTRPIADDVCADTNLVGRVWRAGANQRGRHRRRAHRRALFFVCLVCFGLTRLFAVRRRGATMKRVASTKTCRHWSVRASAVLSPRADVITDAARHSAGGARWRRIGARGARSLFLLFLFVSCAVLMHYAQVADDDASASVVDDDAASSEVDEGGDDDERGPTVADDEADDVVAVQVRRCAAAFVFWR